MAVDVPVSIWRNTSGYGEFDNTGAVSIVDTTGVSLVDTAGIQIVDTGVTFTNIPATAWEEDDSN